MEKITLGLSELYRFDVCTYGGALDISETPEDFDVQELQNELGSLAGKTFGTYIETEFKKHGLKVEGFSFYMPQSYNYRGDSVDVSYTVEDETIAPELLPRIKEYLDNHKEPSCDGYMSLEPSTVEEVDKTDYAFIWSILDEDTMKDLLEDFVEAAQELIPYDEEN